MAKEFDLLQLSTYQSELDLEQYWSGDAKTETPVAPIQAYDENHLQRWQERVQNGGFSDMTIRTIHTVNGKPVPIRWIANLAETAQVWERMSRLGVTPPNGWELMGPVHINGAVNKGDIEQARAQAYALALFAEEYLMRYHPDIPIPTLEMDNHVVIPNILEQGRVLYDLLPTTITEELAEMATKHTVGSVDREDSAAYLLAHYFAYGLINIANGEDGLFSPRGPSLFVVPRSEARFLAMMKDAEPAVAQLGHEVTVFGQTDSLITFSTTLSTPHYYPHRGSVRNHTEPALEHLDNPQKWPTKNLLVKNGYRGKAQDEILAALQLIEEDIGGKQNLPDLVAIVRRTLYSV